MAILHLQVEAGFGNRLRAMLSGILLAEDLQIELYVYWYSKDRACSISFDKVFDIQTLPPFVRVYDSRLEETRQCLHPKDKEDILQEWDKVSDLSLCSYGNFHIPSRERWLAYLRCLKPSTMLFRRIEERMPPFEKDNLIGVHIRRGDNWKAIEYSPVETFLEVLDKEKGFFVVATDDLGVRSLLADRYRGRITFPARILGRDSEEAMINGLVDFFCLSRCPLIYGSEYSSFNEMAAAYGKSNLKKLIA